MSSDAKIKPPLLALLVCERALVDEDKIVSLIRIVDTFNFIIEPESLAQQKLEEMNILIQCTVFTRWGPGRGEFTAELRIAAPNGVESPQVGQLKFQLPGGFHFQQIRHNVNFVTKQSGIYVFRIYLDNELTGEYPFRVNIEQKPPSEHSKQ